LYRVATRDTPLAARVYPARRRGIIDDRLDAVAHEACIGNCIAVELLIPRLATRDKLEKEDAMDEIERNDGDYEDEDEQIEQMIIENGILLHSLAALLVRKGILKQEEIDAEMDRLYDEMEDFEQQ